MRIVALTLMLFILNKGIAQDYYLAAGTYTKWEKSEGIYLYTFDSKTGDTKFVSSIYTENPSFLALSKDGKHLYSVNESGKGKGALSTFALNHERGSLTFLGKQLTHGDEPCYIGVHPSGKWILTANYTGGNLTVFPIQKNGVPGPSVQVIQHTGHGADKERQEAPHVHSTVFSPDGRYLAAVDLGTDEITVYPFDATQSKPLGKPSSVLHAPAGSGPRHITFSPTTPYAYLIDEMAGNVTAYKWNEGKLDSVQVISSHPAEYKGERASAAIHLSPDGNFLYTSNRGESNTIAIFAVDRSNGKLSSVGFKDTGGDQPRDFAIDPTGNYLFVGNMKSSSISIFRRNRQTGALTDAGKKITITEPTHLLFTHIK